MQPYFMQSSIRISKTTLDGLISCNLNSEAFQWGIDDWHGSDWPSKGIWYDWTQYILCKIQKWTIYKK